MNFKAALIGVVAIGLGMLLGMQAPPPDPPGTTRTFTIGDIIYAYDQPRYSVYKLTRFEDNLIVISSMSNRVPEWDLSISLATGCRFTLGAKVFEIQSWDKEKGTVTLTVVR